MRFDMKMVQLLSVAVLAIIVTACGSAQPYQYGQLGSFPQTNGINQTFNGTPYGSEPIITSGQIVGYKNKISLIHGATEVYQYLLSSNLIPGSVQVNAGEKIMMNLSQSRYGIYRTQCMGVINVVTNLHQSHAIPTGEIYLNGQLVPSGTVAPTGGTMQFKPTLPPLSANCTVVSYQMSLMNAVYKESCTNTNGQPMNCP
jgi:hypothetical protein